MHAYIRAAQLAFLAVLLLCVTTPSAQQPGRLPTPQEGDYLSHDFHFKSGETLPELRIHYATFGTPVRDAQGAVSMINARSETAGEKPAFRDALKSRRCLIPADGFYEWKRDGKTKQPFCFQVNQGQLFAFAGLWDRWKDPSGNWIKTCSILTTTPNAVTSAVHDRMPVIIDPEAYDLWLDPGMTNVAAACEHLKPYDARLVRCYPVSTRINHVINDDEECSLPVELAEAG